MSADKSKLSQFLKQTDISFDNINKKDICSMFPSIQDTSSKGGKAKACIPCHLKCLVLTYIFGNGRIYKSQSFQKIVHAVSPVIIEPVLELVHCHCIHYMWWNSDPYCFFFPVICRAHSGASSKIWNYVQGHCGAQVQLKIDKMCGSVHS